MAFVAMFKIWPLIMARINERRRDTASEKASDWERLRDEVGRLSGRVEALERKVDDCERERDAERTRANAAEAELIRFRAYHEGTGQGRQTAQMIVSTERTKGGAKQRGGEK